MDVLCFVAHPDDETVFAGGLLALLVGRGARVHLLAATRGEGGEPGEPPLCKREELGAVRETELRCAARELGAHSPTFLGYRDPDVGPGGQLFPFAEDAREAAARLTDYIRAHPVEVVISHGSNGEYGHPGHRQANQAARLAVQGLGAAAPLLYGFSADFAEHPRRRLANVDDLADFVLDISPAFDRKLAAARCHRTQGAVFVRRVSLERGYPVPLEEALTRLESLHCLWPKPKPAVTAAPGSPQDAFADWVRRNLGDCLRPFTRAVPAGQT